MKFELMESEMVEVVLTKEMPYGHYKQMIAQSKKKGWKVQAYQLGRYSEGLKTKIE